MASIHKRAADLPGSDDMVLLVTEAPERWASAVRQWRASGFDVVVCHCAIVASVIARAWKDTFTDGCGLMVVCQSAAESAHNNYAPGEGDVPSGWVAVGYRWAGADWHSREAECLRLLDSAGITHHTCDGDPPMFLLGWLLGWADRGDT